MLLLLALACAPADLATPDAVRDYGVDYGDDLLAALVSLDGPLEVLFAPDDPVEDIEVALIQEVIDARALDEGTYSEGANPYRIRYAVYNLRNEAITVALLAAETAGVDVQILIEQDQLDPARDWNWTDDWLIEQGFEYVPDNREDFDATTADLIGVGGSGLMHLKTRLFETPDRTRLLTGSMNPGDNAVFNEETLHLINDAALISRYQLAYEAVLFDEPFLNLWTDQPAEVLFSPSSDGPVAGERVMDWVAEEQEQILLMVYSLRDLTADGHERSLVELLGDKVAAGIPVYVITDREQSDGYGDGTEDALRAVGVHVYEASNTTTEYTSMHSKIAVLGRGDIRVITDAANWSKAGLGSATSAATNQESTLFLDTTALDGGRTGRRYLAQWLRVLERYAHQSADDGEPSYEQVREHLFAQSGWPMEEVTFSAEEAHTVWGERILVRGNLHELGTWGSTHEGVPLWTDGYLYPAWMAVESVSLPVGMPFSWKFVASDGENVRWEDGENRVGLAQPVALTPGGSVVGSWR